jgi:hypothetical protein
VGRLPSILHCTRVWAHSEAACEVTLRRCVSWQASCLKTMMSFSLLLPPNPFLCNRLTIHQCLSQNATCGVHAPGSLTAGPRQLTSLYCNPLAVSWRMSERHASPHPGLKLPLEGPGMCATGQVQGRDMSLHVPTLWVLGPASQCQPGSL